MLAEKTTPWITFEMTEGARVELCAGPFFNRS